MTGARVAAIERDGGRLAGHDRERRALLRADPGQCRGRLGGRSRAAGRRAAARPRAQAADDHHLRRAARHRARRACRSPRRSATSSISRRRAGACSPRRWTRCRASRATPSPTNMRSRSPPTGWRSGRSSRSSRIHSRWAGLRTFTPDRHPAVGFAPDAEGFFWLAGQGGFGLQTSPAMAAIAASLIAGDAVADRRRDAPRS